RGRLPGPAELGHQHIRVSAAVAVARLTVAALLAVAVPGAAVTLAASVVGVFLVAVVYESVRSHAGTCGPATRPPAACVALWVISGGGYCVRGLTGLVLATGTQVSWTGLALAGFACWSAGVVFVTTRWAVESIPFVTRRNGQLEWVASPHAGRGHLLALAYWLPHDATAAPHDLRNWRLLRSRRPWHAPWNIALLIALASAWLAGAQLADTAVTRLPALVLSAGVVLAGGVTVIQRPRLLTGATAISIFVLTAFALFGTAAASTLSVVVCVAYLWSTHQSLSQVGTLYQRRIQPGLAAVRAVRMPSRPKALTPGLRPTVIEQASRQPLGRLSE
ncbi:MAG: putative rane protein, partial [Pseudonocardiales bacterium]|nr:putative rane protein [Pseudonocardiales bacterium]